MEVVLHLVAFGWRRRRVLVVVIVLSNVVASLLALLTFVFCTFSGGIPLYILEGLHRSCLIKNLTSATICEEKSSGPFECESKGEGKKKTTAKTLR